ncbi:4-alpha-glucanotransferase/malto-oligosyltrehalose synthase,TIGR02401 [Mucilaginibacter pineti]|uniref:4-alpha-glucanotransferase n=1 Tax=Mucilaginibacter pineti TaxID=1391627 RepID=A0A1G7H7M3_9SPHI|nr:malto-oligosyltrehalose synthase [Mucilaginibacter pineti]SDE96119.1 4-alpha-glucanotransferase/malto-oligosyltrehalose synthase,TIGR02401 [Mucilaginibacter pineti]
MYNPIATYRLQFHKDFTFRHLKKILPYLHELGVKTIYASPVFEAVPGSNHGYDVVNPHRINPEIGTLEELEDISAALKKLDIGWLQDIVPNHMAFHQANNRLMDVLENGRESQYASFFDIIWEAPEFDGKLMVPFLGSPLPNLIKDGEIRLIWANGRIGLQYADQTYPVNSDTYFRVFQLKRGNVPHELQVLLESTTTGDEIKDALHTVRNNTPVAKYIKSALEVINKNTELLQQVAEEQHYRLSFWKDSDEQINYRRFFTVNGLICLNIQEEAVFNEYHRFIKELLDKGIFQGLRVDHIDGLYNPAGYLDRLRKLAGPDVYIVVEKILESGEHFPADWPVQGNTGYDFLAIVNNLLTAYDNKSQFTAFYKQHIQNGKTIERSILEKKAAILHQHMAGELENLTRLFFDLNLITPARLRKVQPGDIKSVIAEFLIRCSVYRFYGNQLPLSKEEARSVSQLLKAVKADKPQISYAVHLLKNLLTRPAGNEERRADILRFYQRCMQFTGPLMAKGVEDTLMYTYERFIGHNEVGDSPAEFGLKISTFHQMMTERQEKFPFTMNTTSTHDTKRGEDVRAKLNVLTEMPGEWFKTVTAWQSQYEKIKKSGAPDANDEYLIYQTLAGSSALPGQEQDNLAERFSAYLTKALREGKVNSQWAAPNENYEQATLHFAQLLLKPQSSFMKRLDDLQAKLADHFVINSLVQVLLKFTCPGVPDIYQGCELWDFSLVDPDNRRPVDFETRARQVNQLRDLDPKTLWDNRYNGSLKFWLTDKLLHQRGEYPELFSKGVYIPLQVKGKYRNNVVAFARRYHRDWLLIAAPLHLAKLTDQTFPGFDWEDTTILLPEDAPVQWTNLLNGEKSIINPRAEVSAIFKEYPFCVLKADNQQKRSAGIIMHITSLPSRYGVGDIGPGARAFADFLGNAQQRYWQLLPLNPTSEATGYSPYSSASSMAGNTLLISPDDLVADGLLSQDDVAPYYLSDTATVDFDGAGELKNKLFVIACHRFRRNASSEEQEDYIRFKKKESSWLDDYALFAALKDHHKGLPWYDWGIAFKHRDNDALASFSNVNQGNIEYVKWLQFKFFQQWTKLKGYTNHLGIQLIGDLPFYVSYDSADAWTHPEIFSLDNNKNMIGVAGVPPDYFNENGQLWGMPVYRWDKLKSTGYGWWIDRIKRNRAFFDVIRLDHFRAFNDYWEVPATETIAVNGCWKAGPGVAIFDVFKKVLDGLPFIAEDLGKVGTEVYELRNKLGLPGMNVLQFAFGADMPVSVHAPHNHMPNSVTYTGTHDNNTSRGWYKEDLTATERALLAAYLRTAVNERNVDKLMMELCYASVSAIAIMPLQDVLGLSADARMNIPSSKHGNWLWRLLPGQLKPQVSTMLRRMVKLYNR